MDAIKIGLGLLLNGLIGVFPIVMFAMAMLFFLCKKRNDIIILAFELWSIILIVSLTTLGLYDNYELNWSLQNCNYIPFYNNWYNWKNALSGNLRYLIQIVGNVFIFAPFGYIYRQIHGNNIRKMCIVAGLFPLGIEIVQMLFGRVADIDDIICNFVGAMFGYYVNAYYSYTRNKQVPAEIELVSVKGKEITPYFKIGWKIICLVCVIRLITLG